MRVCFASSDLSKLHVREVGTDAVLQRCDQATEIVLSGMALPELVLSFYRLQREGKITPVQCRQLKSSLLADIDDAVIGDLTPVVLAHAIASLAQYALRGMDPLHIATALALKVDVFVSADQRQLAAAARSGLRGEAA